MQYSIWKYLKTVLKTDILDLIDIVLFLVQLSFGGFKKEKNQKNKVGL